MGIPFYYHYLSKKYDNIISHHLPNKLIDLFCLDYNGIIHPICQSTIHLGEQAMLDALWKHTLKLIEVVKPAQTLVSIDGVAPLAKITQQRKRRYLSSINKQNKWDSNNITHGTPFMKRLSSYIRDRCLQHNILFDHNDGEAEHKIMDMIHKPEHQDKTVVIHGLDADLILLSLMSRCKNVYLMREQETNLKFVDVNNLRDVIVNEWGTVFKGLSEQRDIIHSYCVCCSLIGNDFIPHPLTLNVKNNAMNKIKQAASTAGDLVRNNTIDIGVLTGIISNLAKNEDTDLTGLIHHRHSNDPDEKTILRNPTKWRKHYYQNIVFIHSVNDACHEFLNGIFWTFNYYNKDISTIDHGWFYPFNAPPSLRDLANYALTYSYVPNGTLTQFIPSDLKLLIVIPRSSMDALPDHLRICYEDDSYGITFMYPKNFRLISFLKEHDWEYTPCLPIIDIDLIASALKKCAS